MCAPGQDPGLARPGRRGSAQWWKLLEGCGVVTGDVGRERSAVVSVPLPASAGQRTLYVRHPGDVIRVALGAVLVMACSVIASAE